MPAPLPMPPRAGGVPNPSCAPKRRQIFSRREDPKQLHNSSWHVPEGRPMASEQSYRRTVLLVDDDASLRELLARILAAEGYSVVTAENGEEALAIAHTLDGQLGLVVTDVRMPVMDGLQLATHLTRLKSAPPVLFISGYSTLQVTGPLLYKPFNAAALLEHVARLLPRVEHWPSTGGAPGPETGQRSSMEVVQQ